MTAALEERVAALEELVEQLGAVPDTIAPATGQTIAPDGAVTYDFEGRVKATGLELEAGDTSSPTDPKKVRWIRDGAAEPRVAEMSGFHTALLRGWYALVDTAEGPQGEFKVVADNIAGGLSIASARAFGGGGDHNRVIVDSEGRSHFVQLPAIDALKLNAGGDAVNFPNSMVSDTTTIFHGLGVTPLAVLLTNAFGPFGVQSMYVTGRDGNSFSVRCTSTVTLDGLRDFDWLAIG